MYGNTCYIYGSFLIINTYTFAMKHHCFCEIQNVMKISGSQITTKWFDYISHDLKHKICPEISTVPRMNKNDRVAQAGISDHHLRKREVVVLLLFCQVLQTFVLILKYSTKEHCSID